MKSSLTLCAFIGLALTMEANAKTICTLVAEPTTGTVLFDEGDCDLRTTPASTFKLALAMMAFDAGILSSPHEPVLPFKKGYPDWGGANWTKPTDPAAWMKYSVVWYSQQITPALGETGLARYADSFGYGNADFSGDPGQNNGLERAWISSSLKISPREQVTFLSRFINRDLPISDSAMGRTAAIASNSRLGDWTMWGKTGAAYPRNKDGSFDRARGWGWYVGWAQKGEQTLVFARLEQDDKRVSGSPGIRNRDRFQAEWPDLLRQLGR